MDRYSLLYGTNQNDVYKYLGHAKNLSRFINSLNGENPDSVIEKTLSFMAGSGNAGANGDEPFPTIRYAPLYMNRLEGMRSDMKPFYALSVNAPERKPGNRPTTYEYVYFLGRDCLSKQEGGYCFIDHVFGSHLATWEDVRDYREGKRTLSFNAPPRRVDPILQNEDAALLYGAIKHLYANKLVVIRLPEDDRFIHTAMDLLTQLYSLLPESTGMEVGFAVNVSAEQLIDIPKKTYTRIFVQPASASVNALTSDYTLFDLSQDGQILPSSGAFQNVLSGWAMHSWEHRRDAMRVLFRDARFLDGEAFLSGSQQFLSDPFFTWINSDQDNGTIGSFAELKAKHDSFSACRIPWCAELFKRRSPALLKPEMDINTLAGEELAVLLLSSEKESGKEGSSDDIKIQDIVAFVDDPITMLRVFVLRARDSFLAYAKSLLEKKTLAYEDEARKKDKEHEEAIAALKTEQQREIKRIEAEKKSFEESASKAENRAQKAETEKESVQKKLKNANSELERARSEKKKAEETNRSLEAQLRKKDEDLQDIENDLKRAQEDARKLREAMPLSEMSSLEITKPDNVAKSRPPKRLKKGSYRILYIAAAIGLLLGILTSSVIGGVINSKKNKTI